MRNEEKTAQNSVFKALRLPAGQYVFIPRNLDILIPKAPRIPLEARHHLAYLPWEYKYLDHVPAEYHKFFTYVLPFLHARTSNVHTALSMAQLPYLLKGLPDTVNRRHIYLALILHDCGWSQVGQYGILNSLNYNGVVPSGEDSRKPKQQHLVYGEALAYKLLDSFDFENDPLTSEDIYTISEIIRRHDHDAAWESDKYGPISQEIRIMCDSDRLWSYTHENFWLDTIRKNVPAESYLELITDEIETYFFTPAGRARARALIGQRAMEVKAYSEIMHDADMRSDLILRARHPSKRVLYRARQLVLSAKSRRIQRGHIRENAY